MFDSGSTIEFAQLIFGVLLLVSMYYLFFKFFYDRKRLANLTKDELKYDAIRRIYKKLKTGKLPSSKIVNKNANNIENRILIYDVLTEFNKIDLFPKNLLSIEKASESYLANWLYMNDDFDSFPDEIVLESKLKLKNAAIVVIYKYKNYPDDWMIGYVCYKDSKTNPYSVPFLIMSDFSNNILSIDEIENKCFHKK